MGRIKLFIFLMLIVLGMAAFWKLDMSVMKLHVKGLENPQQAQNKIESIKERIDDAAIIRNAFKSVGVLGVLEGEEEYRQLIEEENWYSYRSINMDWRFKFAIAANLDNIALRVDNGVVLINIDREKLYIWFIEKSTESTSNSYASILARKYTANEISALEKAVKEKVEMKIKNTGTYWMEGYKSLQTNLTKLCNELGYYNVIFEDENPNY